MDIIQFNSTSGLWELVTAPSVTGVQSSSNVGGGAGLALTRVLDDLPFKSLTKKAKAIHQGKPRSLRRSNFRLGSK